MLHVIMFGSAHDFRNVDDVLCSCESDELHKIEQILPVSREFHKLKGDDTDEICSKAILNVVGCNFK